MKDLLVMFAFLVLIIIALRVLFWTVSAVLPVALAIAAVYVGVLLLRSKRRGAA